MLPLTTHLMAQAYEANRAAKPFTNRGWSLPPAEQVEFVVALAPQHYGWYKRGETARHRITLSTAVIGSMPLLMEIMAHEMIHAVQHEHGTADSSVHNADFVKRAKSVCHFHGYDFKAFL